VEVEMSNSPRVGVMINARSTSHSHFRSLIEEGLWGFPLDRRGVNESRWSRVCVGAPVLVYCEHRGVRGVWMLGEVVGRERSSRPVGYWVESPSGYPLHVRLRFLLPRAHAPTPESPLRLEWLDEVRPVTRDELATVFGLKMFRARHGRWSLVVFSDVKVRGVTYPLSKFKEVLDEFEARNRLLRPPERLDHETVKKMLYVIGQIQGRYPEREYPLEDKRVDVVWRKTSRSVPAVVFKVSIGGDLYADLVKLKHAHDLWNSIAVLVTTPQRAEEARRWIAGTFHEARDYFRVLTLDQVRQYYEAKRKVKEIESLLRLP